MKMNKGIQWDVPGWLIISLIILIVVLIMLGAVGDKLGEIISKITKILRFGF